MLPGWQQNMNWTRCLPRQGSQIVASFDCCFCKSLSSQAPAEITLKKVQDPLLLGKEKFPYRKSGLQILQGFFRQICGCKEKLELSSYIWLCSLQTEDLTRFPLLSWLMSYQHRLRRSPVYRHWQEVAFGKLHFLWIAG